MKNKFSILDLEKLKTISIIICMITVSICSIIFVVGSRYDTMPTRKPCIRNRLSNSVYCWNSNRFVKTWERQKKEKKTCVEEN